MNTVAKWLLSRAWGPASTKAPGVAPPPRDTWSSVFSAHLHEIAPWWLY